MSNIKTSQRNPGPPWGYRTIVFWDKVLPQPLVTIIAFIGSAIGMSMMPAQRQHSRNYLKIVLNRDPSLLDICKHFHVFTIFLIKKMRAARGIHNRYKCAEGDDSDFLRLARTQEPALFGAFHVGQTDLMGYFLSDFDRKINMIRLKVENSNDTEWLGEKFKDYVSFIWVNDEKNLLFALKKAIESNQSIAMKCDRLGYSSKTEYFHFLGAERQFPFTIYHLSILFNIPVIFSIGLESNPGETELLSSPLYRPTKQTKRENITAAKQHFQDVLRRLESLLYKNPFIWFNFEPLNPERATSHAV